MMQTALLSVIGMQLLPISYRTRTDTGGIMLLC
jgi:hypothetical protein